MKKKLDKKRTRILSRFCALLSSLLLCMCLTVPAFASNNASTQKWYVAAEGTMPTESGANGRYLKLTPYVGAEEYAWTFQTSFATSSSNVIDGYDVWVNPINYPQVWRSSIPLGANCYVDVSSFVCNKLVWDGSVIDDPNQFPYELHFFTSDDLFAVTGSSTVSSAFSLSQTLYSLPVKLGYYKNANVTVTGYAQGIICKNGSSSALKLLSDCSNFRFTIPPSLLDGQKPSDYGITLQPITDLYNASSDDLGMYVLPQVSQYFSTSDQHNGYNICSAVVSFWVDANKLPAGLEVGDEFPANDDAFEELREDLLEQFPESEEHINNDKAGWEDLRDAETIPEDAANSFFELLGGVFQIDMFATIALMVCGFTALLILTRKAMN